MEIMAGFISANPGAIRRNGSGSEAIQVRCIHKLELGRAIMTFIIILLLGVLMNTSAFADTITFDKIKPGALPPGWIAGVTGKGSPKWAVEADSSAPSAPHVLKQSGEASYPWCVKEDLKFSDGFVEVKFKALSGKEDQAGGLMWRWKNGDNYYVARANALENNVSLYYTEGGSRKTIKYVNAPVSPNEWHTLRSEFSGKHITVSLDGKSYIELEDSHISGAGAVGVWTKADSVTAFDDLIFGKK